MRRLLGPIGGPIVFFLVAALVFGGLGWVTYSALRVEEAQRETAARADLGNKLSEALWRLDTRLLPTLAIEDGRHFNDYAPPNPDYAPLLTANLPDWMKLHFQIDSAAGWCSPQVLPTDTPGWLRTAWSEVAPPNLTPERAAVLAELKWRCPAPKTLDAFAATDRKLPDDSSPLLVRPFSAIVSPSQTNPTPNPTPQPPLEPIPKPAPADPTSNNVPGLNPEPDAKVIRALGLELCWRNDQALANNVQQNLHSSQKKITDEAQTNQAGQPAPGPRPNQQPGVPQLSSRGARMGTGQKDADNRADIIDRALREAKQAAEHQFPKGPFQNYGQNSMGPADPRNQGNQTNPGPVTPTGPPGTKNDGTTYATPTGPGGGGGFPAGPPVPGPVAPGAVPQTVPALPGPGPGGADANGKAPTKSKSYSPPGQPGERDGKYMVESADETLKAMACAQEMRDLAQNLERDLSKKFDNTDPASMFETYGWLLRSNDDRSGKLRNDKEAGKGRPREAGDAVKAGIDKDAEVPAVPPVVDPQNPPAGNVLMGGPVGGLPGAVIPPAGAAVQPRAIHLGSMRPQWVTAPDGSEMLVLVRAARIDNRTVYQGVVVDWEKLQAELKERVQDLFPDAKLVPAKDLAAAPPDRTMTSLPVQLDPGPEPPLAPAGWTPLRMGLVLAWVAAIIAFAAVGFAGWSLIDLAERRIRFVSAVTHELRTPLTSLRLYLDLLVSGMIQDEQKRQEYLSTLTMESDRLHRLIDNVLDFAKLEKRKKNGDIKPVNVAGLLDQVRQTWTDRVAQDGKELVVISTLPAEREVSTDAAMVQQIVGNLIDNARKYTRDAADRRIWVWAKPGAGNTVVLEVEDRGAGVPAGERKSIFKPFRRGEQADSKAGGAGLGLALAKSWAEVLGARLAYRPADGGTGACFRLELPGK
jgi:signal transduction histidine kinase